MMFNLNKEEREKLIDYMYEIGFIFDATPLMELKTDDERFKRLKEYVKEGYRIMLFHNERPELINVEGKTVSSELSNQIIQAYNWLTSTSATPTSTEGMELSLNPIPSTTDNQKESSGTKPLNEGI